MVGGGLNTMVGIQITMYVYYNNAVWNYTNQAQNCADSIFIWLQCLLKAFIATTAEYGYKNSRDQFLPNKNLLNGFLS